MIDAPALRLGRGGERFLLEVGNGVLNHTKDASVDHPTATVTLTRTALVGIVTGLATLETLVANGAVSIDGDGAAFADFLGLLDSFEFWFNIVTP